jgi:23S rRNA-/tRNA-specific pseudouridylate synthase
MRGTFTIDDLDVGTRIDVFVTRHAEGISRSRVTLAIKDGAVVVNGHKIKPSHPLELGDIVECEVYEAVAIDAKPQNIPLDIVFEDDTLLVVNKAMQARYIKREYRGIVNGIPRDPEGTITGAIGRDARNRLRYAIRADGKPAVTHYIVREELIQAAECVFRLETGRTHQIRVHLAALGHPLLCDPLYGRSDTRFPVPGQALHAWRLGFKHPKTKEMLQFEVDPPREYLVTLAMLRA